MNEQEKIDAERNKALRGYIIRCLAKVGDHTSLVRAIANAMFATKLITSHTDISKYINYLHVGGYIEFCPQKATAYTAYKQDAAIKLTKQGIDLAEYTITDAGVDV